MVEHELWRLAQEILRLGVSVVLDFGLWAQIERDEMRSAARGLGVGVELHYLDVPTDELWRRVEARNSEPPWDSYPIRRADLDRRLRVFQAPDAAELALFDPRQPQTEPLPIKLQSWQPTRSSAQAGQPNRPEAPPQSSQSHLAHLAHLVLV